MNYRKTRTISGKGNAPALFADALRGLCVDSADTLYVAGDTSVKMFSSDGTLTTQWRTSRPGFSIAVAREGDEKDGTIYVGEPGQVEIFDARGQLRRTWHDVNQLGLVTAIGFSGKTVLLADAKARCIRKYDGSGKHLGNIGDNNRKKGFHLPNGHLDFAVCPDGSLYAINSGIHRIEHYALDGRLLGHIGRFTGVNPEGFTGCCNPTNIALTPNGRIAVTVKAKPAVKLYDDTGKLLAMFGEKDFDPACKNTDIVVDSTGRVHVIDTVRLHILTFEPIGPAAAATPPKSDAAHASPTRPVADTEAPTS